MDKIPQKGSLAVEALGPSMVLWSLTASQSVLIRMVS